MLGLVLRDALVRRIQRSLCVDRVDLRSALPRFVSRLRPPRLT